MAEGYEPHSIGDQIFVARVTGTTDNNSNLILSDYQWNWGYTVLFATAVSNNNLILLPFHGTNPYYLKVLYFDMTPLANTEVTVDIYMVMH